MSARTGIGVLIVGLTTAPADAEKIYWAQTLYEGSPPVARHVIRQADADGSNIQDAVNTGAGAPYSIAFDPPRRDMYWTRGAAIYRGNLDGSLPELVLSTETPQGIAVDCEGKRIYWTFGLDFYGGIRSATLDGTDVRTVFTKGGPPDHVAVDPRGKKVYWTALTLIRRCDFDGTEVETVVAVSAAERIWGLAVDGVEGKLYWAVAGNQADPPPERVERSNLDGTQTEVLVTLDPAVVADVAVHQTIGKIFWHELKVGVPSRIRRADLDGTNVEDVVTTGQYAGLLAVDFPHCIPTLSALSTILLSVALLATGAFILRRRSFSSRLKGISTTIGVAIITFSCANDRTIALEPGAAPELTLGSRPLLRFATVAHFAGFPQAA
jgi:hypothetical protein